MEFSPPLFRLDLILLAPKPKPLDPIWNLVKPFSQTVWICILAAVIATGILFAQLTKDNLGFLSIFVASAH